MRIGFIGLGAMGAGMARNILTRHGQLGAVAHRSRTTIDALVAQGAREWPDAAALARESDMVILCLPNSEVVEAAVAAMAPALREGHIIIDTGTSSLASSQGLEATLAARGVAFAEAPLTGGQAQAEAGALGALVGASPETFARIRPLLEMTCETVQHFGPVGAGAKAKFINNYMVMGIAALVAEAFDLAAETGTDWAMLYEAVLRGSADSGVLRRMVGPARDGDFGGYVFSVENAAKDMGYITGMTAAMGHDSAMNHAVKDLFDRAVAQGHGKRRLSELLRPEIRPDLRAR